MNTGFNFLSPLSATAEKLRSYFFDKQYDASALVVFRIGTGIILLLQLLQLLPDLRSFIGETGLIRPDISSIEIPRYILTSSKLTEWISIHCHSSLTTALNLLAVAYSVSIVCIIVGLFTRISTLVCLLLHVAFVYSGHFFSYGVDYFLNIFLFYLLLFPVNAEFSADKYLFRLKPVNNTPYIRLLQLHLCIVYLISGVAKAFGINWWNGVSIWKAINRPDIVSYDTQFLAGYSSIFTVIGILTILIEALYIILINIKQTRRLWLAMTCLFHLSIAIVLHLPIFAAVMILFNIVAFYLPQKYCS